MYYNYYNEELRKLNEAAPTINIKLTDFYGNETNSLSVNAESLPALIAFLSIYVNNKGDL